MEFHIRKMLAHNSLDGQNSQKIRFYFNFFYLTTRTMHCISRQFFFVCFNEKSQMLLRCQNGILCFAYTMLFHCISYPFLFQFLLELGRLFLSLFVCLRFNSIQFPISCILFGRNFITFLSHFKQHMMIASGDFRWMS